MLMCLLATDVLAATRSVQGRYSISGWSIEDGLPHNLPLAIAQDSRGHIWIGTWEGLVRFNGHDFTVYDRSNTGGAELIGGSLLLAEADNSMLVGTGNGIYRYFQGQWHVLNRKLSGLRIDAMQRDGQGALWVASSQRLFRIDAIGNLQELATDKLPGPINVLTAGHDGQMLIGTDSGLYRIDAGKVRRLGRGSGIDGEAVLDIVADGQAWLLATTAGLWQIDAGERITALRPGERINRVVRDHEGALWLNFHDDQLVRREPDGREVPFPLPGVRSRSLMRDRDGLIWTGSTEGLYRLARGAAQAIPGSEGYTRAVLQTANGSLWMGHANGLRRLHQGKAVEMLAGSGALAPTSVLALGLSADGNGLWVGTYDRGVLQLDNAGRLRRHIPIGLAGASTLVRAVLETSDGSVWIGTGGAGLLRWRDGRLQAIDETAGLPARQIQALYADPAGGILVGTLSGMAQVSLDGKVRYYEPDVELPARSVFDFLRDADGTLWIACDRGLLRLQDGRYTLYDKRNGLPHDKLFRILDDGEHLWLSSNRGVLRVARHELEQVHNGELLQLSVLVVDQTDGMPDQSNGGSWPAGWLTRMGSLLFPTANGLGRIEQDRLQARRVAPVPVEVEQVQIDGELHEPWRPVVMAADARRLVVSYIGLDFHAPRRVRYRYRLVGFDHDWIEAGSNNEAVFTNLPAGDYRFEVEAMQLPRNWADRERVGSSSLQVQVRAPLWQHPAVILCVVLTVLALPYGIIGMRTAAFRRRQQGLQRVIDIRTRELVDKNLALEQAGKEYAALVQQLAEQAHIDALTGLPNRRAGDAHLHKALQAANAGGPGCCVALLDVDWFKQVNDTHGHEAGDILLRDLARELESSECGAVFVARHGGEEFLLVLDGQDLATGLRRMERLRQQAEASLVTLDHGRQLRYTVSIGVAAYGPGQDTVRSLLAAADACLYRAKRDGRNRVVG